MAGPGVVQCVGKRIAERPAPIAFFGCGSRSFRVLDMVQRQSGLELGNAGRRDSGVANIEHRQFGHVLGCLVDQSADAFDCVIRDRRAHEFK